MYNSFREIIQHEEALNGLLSFLSCLQIVTERECEIWGCEPTVRSVTRSFYCLEYSSILTE